MPIRNPWIRMAVGPGAFATVALCVSAPGVLAGAVQMSSWVDGALFVLLFPCPVWGPLLGAAVFAYWRRRNAAQTRSSRHQPGRVRRIPPAPGTA
jgi:hypothetical protein